MMPARIDYDQMPFRPCGASGLKLPALALGVGRNFGAASDGLEAGRIARRALELGVVHFDTANVYGSPAGSAEETVGRILRDMIATRRQELVISTKAGSPFGPGPYQRGSGRKSLLGGIDGSLHRLGLDYVDLFYSHIRDPETPLEETAAAFEQVVRQGKTLFIGISNYNADDTRTMHRLLADRGIPLTIQQPQYSMMDRSIEENGLLQLAGELGFGFAVYSPLARGLLTGKYNEKVPEDSMEARRPGALGVELDDGLRRKLDRLTALARERGQTLSQMALNWVHRDPRITCAIIGARTVEQLEENVQAVAAEPLSDAELDAIDHVLAGVE